MPSLSPFRAVRPLAEIVGQVVSKSVDSYTQEEVKAVWEASENSFLRIIKPEGTDQHVAQDNNHLQAIKSAFRQKIRQGVLVQEQEPCMYLYRQTQSGVSHTGIIALASVKDYEIGNILIHEQTLTEREQKLMNYLTVCNFHAEPVLLFHKKDSQLSNIITNCQAEKALYHFTREETTHEVWKIDATQILREIQQILLNHKHFYVADGHHRSASSVLLSKFRMQHPDSASFEGAADHFLTALFSEEQLSIHDFNRAVTSLNNLSEQTFLDCLKEVFTLQKEDTGSKPQSLHQLGMYLNGTWYSLQLKEKYLNTEKALDGLDAELLNKYILAPILGISDMRNDKRMLFIRGTEGMQGLEKRVNEGKASVAFALFPVSMEQLTAIAEEHSIMPPKSTYIEPKLPNGMLIYSMDQNPGA